MIVGHIFWNSSTSARVINWEIPNMRKLIHSEEIRSPDFIYDNTSHYLKLSPQHFTNTLYRLIIHLKVFNGYGNRQIKEDMLKAILVGRCAMSHNYLRFHKPDLYLYVDLICFTHATISVEFVRERKVLSTKCDRKLCLGLSQNFKNSFLKKLHTDFQINVGEIVFDVHKMVLASRSPVFAAMFESDMVEKGTNSAHVNDCDPDSFHVFLLFLYSGETENFSRENVLNLYIIATKYQVDELKTECVNYMIDKMSVDKFCDVAALASKYSERELLEVCQNYFKRKTKSILKCEYWCSFLKSNSDLANEFLLLSVLQNDSSGQLKEDVDDISVINFLRGFEP